jgi:hypothetical protein
MCPPFLTFIFFITLLSACATKFPVKQNPEAPSRIGAEPEAPPVTTLNPTCLEPSYLVRDLTVPWAQRTYLVGPCDGARGQRVKEPTQHDTPPLPASIKPLGTDGENRP